MPRFIMVTLLVLTVLTVFSQTNGKWIGTGEYLPGSSFTRVMSNMAANKKLVVNMAYDGSVSGNMVTLYNRSKAIIQNEDGNQLFTIKGRYDAGNQSLLLIITHFKSKPDTSDGYLTFRCPDSVYYDLSVKKYNNKNVIIGVANPQLNKNATIEWVGSFIGGLCKTMGKNIDMHILPLRIRFDSESDFSLQPATEMIQTVYRDSVAPPVKRFTNIQRTITLDTSFIKLDLYDNGEIDGDIATLVLDGKTIIDRQLLGAKAATVFINLTGSGEHTLELFANNLGTIPPNTALVVLTCNKKRYEISLSSDETTNGAVKLVFNPKQF